MESLPEYIALQSAHVTQHTTDGYKKTPWRVEKNITNEKITELPANLSEAQVFSILNFATKFELIAWNEGIAFGKKKTVEVYNIEIDKLKDVLKLATEENERLANVLDKLTRKEV